MKGFLTLWFILNLIAAVGSWISVQYSPGTLFDFPYFHLLGIFSLFFLINIPFYAAFERLREEE